MLQYAFFLTVSFLTSFFVVQDDPDADSPTKAWSKSFHLHPKRTCKIDARQIKYLLKPILSRLPGHAYEQGNHWDPDNQRIHGCRSQFLKGLKNVQAITSAFMWSYTHEASPKWSCNSFRKHVYTCSIVRLRTANLRGR